MKNYKQEIENILKGIHMGQNHDTGEESIEWHSELPKYITTIEGTSKHLLLQEISNLITEILDSCPLEKGVYLPKYELKTPLTRGQLDNATLQRELSQMKTEAYNQAVSKYEAWKKEVKEQLGS